MGNDKKWMGWNKPVTILSLMAITALIVVAYFWLAGKGPQPVFDFDDGTTQGWIGNGIFDDAGKKYDGSLYKVGHGEQHQYPNKFPCTAADPSKCDPLNDKKGSLSLAIAELQPSLPQFNFPSNSNYWQVELISPSLSKLFQNKSEFEASIGDMFGVDPGHVRATLLLNVEVGGSTKQISPVGGGAEQVVSKNSWTKVSEKFSVPPGGYIRNIVVRIRGDWQTYKMYNGGIFVDHVAAIK